jgi:hypothetical protein
VSEISAKSLTISPDTANLADFHLVGALASDWSTLGWIKFRMGDAETAEKYLLAAWRLKQAPSIGERLAEVYEKLGKQTQAAKVCLMALAASDHSAPNEKLSKELEHLRPFLPKLASGSNRSDWSEGDLALSAMRTIHISLHPRLPNSSGSFARFVISFTSSSKPDKVVFESGAEGLRDAIPAITAATYLQTVPDNTPVRIVRRASLSCKVSSNECVLVLMPDTAEVPQKFQVIGAPAPNSQFSPTPGS